MAEEESEEEFAEDVDADEASCEGHDPEMEEHDDEDRDGPQAVDVRAVLGSRGGHPLGSSSDARARLSVLGTGPWRPELPMESIDRDELQRLRALDSDGVLG